MTMKFHWMYLMSLLLIVGLITSCSIDDDGGNNQPEELTTAILPQPESVIIDIPNGRFTGMLISLVCKLLTLTSARAEIIHLLPGPMTH